MTGQEGAAGPRVIDIHAHMASPALLELIAAAGAARPPSFDEVDGGVMLLLGGDPALGPIPHGIHDLAVRIDDMDRQGVDVQLVAVAPILYGYEEPAEVGTAIATAINDMLVDLAAKAPERLLVAGTLPMSDVSASLDELDRLETIPAVRGLQLGTHVAGRNLDDPDLEPIWERIAASRLVVLIHPARVAGAERMRRHHLVNLVGNPADSTIAIASLIFGGVLERNKIEIAFVHGGGFAPYQIGRWDHGWRVRKNAATLTTVPPSVTLAGCRFDTLTHDVRSLRFLGDRFGWDRVMLGSDYPFDMAQDDPVTAVREVELSTDDEARVLGANARAWLHLNHATERR